MHERFECEVSVLEWAVDPVKVFCDDLCIGRVAQRKKVLFIVFLGALLAQRERYSRNVS